MKALVLCAGLGTRLGRLTEHTPKPMLHIGGEPLLAHTLRYLAHYGFTQVAINLHVGPGQIQDYCGDGSRFGVNLYYSHEAELLGTAGGVKALESYFFDSEDFLVIYGDLLVDEDLGAMFEFHQAKAALATLLLHRRSGSNSLVRMDGGNRITEFIERPTPSQLESATDSWVNSGVQILNRSILQQIPFGRPADLPEDVYVPLAGRDRLFGYPLTGYRCAIDSPDRYTEAMEAFAGNSYQSPHMRRSR